MALTLQNAHETGENTVIQDVFINGVVVEKHLYGTGTVRRVKRSFD